MRVLDGEKHHLAVLKWIVYCINTLSTLFASCSMSADVETLSIGFVQREVWNHKIARVILLP